MVDFEIIEDILTKAITEQLSMKCHPTISEMHSMLNGRSVDDVYDELLEADLLNPLEKKDYQHHIVESGILYYRGDYNYFQKEHSDSYDELFNYARRLFEGLPKQENVPSINFDDYESDKQLDKMSIHKEKQKMFEDDEEYMQRRSDLLDSLDGVEKNQVIHQKNRLALTSDDTRVDSMNKYFAGDSDAINYTITNSGMRGLSKEQKKLVRDMDDLINDNAGLLKDTIL